MEYTDALSRRKNPAAHMGILGHDSAQVGERIRVVFKNNAPLLFYAPAWSFHPVKMPREQNITMGPGW